MDDLDQKLFSTALKKIHKTPSFQNKSDLGDFDEDDPLGDLLSSSGEHTPVKVLSRKSPSKEDVNSKQTKSKRVAELFGLNDHDEKKSIQDTSPSSSHEKPIKKDEDPSDWLGLKSDPEIDQNENEKYNPSTIKTHHLLSKTNSRDGDFYTSTLDVKDNLRENYGTDIISRKPLSTTLVEDLSPRAHLSGQRRGGGGTPESKKTSTILNSFMSDFDSKPVHHASIFKGNETDSGMDNNKNSYTPSLNREPRRSSRRREGNLVDPLGLFSSPSEVPQTDATVKDTQQITKKEVETTSAPSIKPSQISNPGQIPHWLGGTSSLPTPAPITTIQPNQTATNLSDLPKATIPEADVQSEIDILTGLASLETQAGEAATQQQKSLITALALKRQEDALLKLQAQQAALLAQHEKQLGALVQRQIQRQQQMVRQQEQIQAHIQALMIQPPPIAPIVLPSTFSSVDYAVRFDAEPQVIMDTTKLNNDKHYEIISDLRGQIQRLETENEDLKEQLENERKRHEYNLKDMEKMFRRQLSAQEEALVMQEKRFNAELETIEKEVSSRVSRLKDEHNEASSQQTQRMAQLHGEWLADLQRLGEFHQQAIEVLRSEQTSAIEHWKDLQAAEKAAIKEASTHARLLELAADHLKENTAYIVEMRDQIRKESQSQCSKKEEFLLKQEVQLVGLREAIEKQAAAMEAERSCLSAMNRDLESRMLRHQQEVNDDKSRFEAREKMWEKERLKAVEILDREKKDLEKLQLEAQAEFAALGERKLALATDVARLEATLHIQSSNANRNSLQAEQMVAEARSTLEAAQEAGREVEREREEIMMMKLNLNSEQRHLETAEREIRAREQQIEEERMRAKAFRDEGISALEEARRLERERTEHASDLAQRLLYLKEREDRLAEEKLAVTIEWKRIQDSRDSVLCSQCGQLASVTMSSSNNSKEIVDPLPIIMKLEAEQELHFATLDRPLYHSTLLESVSQ